MKTYCKNEDGWYLDAQPLWMRLLRWIVWLGGWERIIHDEDGYRYQWRARHAIGLSVRARGSQSKLWALYCSVCPLGLFGYRLVFNNFGFHLRTRRGYWCVTWPKGWPHKAARGRPWSVYRSPNATPWAADLWVVGAPAEVKAAAVQRARNVA